jgi:anti-sigma regulatory factor (Ser/Thr protein kinase)
MPNLRTPKFLIVSDCATRRSHLRERLVVESAGHEILEAESCETALHLAHQYGSELSEAVLELTDNRDRSRINKLVASMDLRFEIDNDVSLVPPLICHLLEQITLLDLLDDSSLSPMSIALSESLSNAINHGNLEMDSELRQEDESVYYDLAAARRVMWPYCDRKVHVFASYSKDRVKFVIRDEGPGFNVKQVKDPTDEDNLERIGGRGLLLIQAFMDEVSHNNRGNEITLVKYTSAGAELLAKMTDPHSVIEPHAMPESSECLVKI